MVHNFCITKSLYANLAKCMPINNILKQVYKNGRKKLIIMFGFNKITLRF